VLSPYGLAIVVVCRAVGFALSLLVLGLVSNPQRRAAIFVVGLTAAVVYVFTRPTGYDRWDRFVAIWYAGGALIGWIVGFLLGARSGRART
jgi:hypothetical protein